MGRHEQRGLAAEFAEYYKDVPFTDERSPALRYYFQNAYFSYGDAIILYSMRRHRPPRRIVEVGSGFSSAVMLDTNERFCSKQMAMTFIDPYPQRLLSLLTEVLFFNSYMAIHHGEFTHQHLPLFMHNPGGGLWLSRPPSIQ